MKSEAAQVVDHQFKKQLTEHNQHVHRLTELEHLLDVLQKELHSNEMKAQEQVEVLKDKYMSMQQSIESRRNSELEKNRQLLIKLKTVEMRVYELEEDKAALQHTTTTMEHRVQQLLQEQQHSEGSIRELSQQLLSSQMMREQGILTHSMHVL
jgi:hypothetical protein